MVLFEYNDEDTARALGDSVETTSGYISSIMKAMANPRAGQVSGLPAPMATNNSMLFSYEGSGSLVTNATTTRVVIMFDPEITLRTGISAAHAAEFNTAGVCTALTTFEVGRTASDFAASGVVFSAMKVENTSGTQYVSGQQSQAIVYTLPKTTFDITMSKLQTLVMRKSQDIASCASNKDGTTSFAPSEHIGSNIAPYMRNTIMRSTQTWFGIGSSANFGIIMSSLTSALNSTVPLPIFDSDAYASAAGSRPFQGYTTGYELDLKLNISDTTAPLPGTNLAFAFRLYDHAGALLAKNDVVSGAILTTSPAQNTLSVHWKVCDTPRPIARLVVDVVNQGTLDATATITMVLGVLTTITEGSDIPCRPVHYCVLEGVNPSASISVRCDTVLAAIPAEETISMGVMPQSMANLDDGLVKLAFRYLFSRMDRASTILQNDSMANSVDGIADEMTSNLKTSQSEMEQAASFGGALRALKKAQKTSSTIARTAQPLLKAYSDTGLPGADAARMANTGINAGRRLGLLTK